MLGYEPNCKRNLLPVEECKLPANNASQIIIGDRTFLIYNLDKNITDIIWVLAKIHMEILEKLGQFQIQELILAILNGYTQD